MAKLEGGIFSNPSGKTAGIVFGAARTRQGKKVTARQLVPPSNPNTTEQQAQRSKFSDSLDIVRWLGASVYQSDFNRAISQLPGFQSMMSIFMNAMDSDAELSAPPVINLGTLPNGEDIILAAAGSGTIGWAYGPEAASPATEDDLCVCFAIAVDSADRASFMGESSIAVRKRSDEGDSFDGMEAGKDYLIGMYFRGAGTAEGMLSPTYWEIVTAGS